MTTLDQYPSPDYLQIYGAQFRQIATCADLLLASNPQIAIRFHKDTASIDIDGMLPYEEYLAKTSGDNEADLEAYMFDEAMMRDEATNAFAALIHLARDVHNNKPALVEGSVNERLECEEGWYEACCVPDSEGRIVYIVRTTLDRLDRYGRSVFYSISIDDEIRRSVLCMFLNDELVYVENHTSIPSDLHDRCSLVLSADNMILLDQVFSGIFTDEVSLDHQILEAFADTEYYENPLIQDLMDELHEYAVQASKARELNKSLPPNLPSPELLSEVHDVLRTLI